MQAQSLSFPPTAELLSMMNDSRPFWDKKPATLSPAIPPPIIATGLRVCMFSALSDTITIFGKSNEDGSLKSEPINYRLP
jgi:hypothetical protein